MPSPEWCSGAVVSLPLASSRIASRGSCRPSARWIFTKMPSPSSATRTSVDRAFLADLDPDFRAPEWSIALLIISVEA